MPLYDYRCKECSKKFTMLVGMIADGKELACPACGSQNLVKLMSRFSSVRSEDQILDDLSDIDKLGDIENPKKLKKWVREMGKSMDEDVEDDLEELFEQEASGQGGGDQDNTVY